MSVISDRRPAAVSLLVAWLVIVATFVLVSDPLRIYTEHSTQGEARIILDAMQPGDEILAYPYTPYSLTWYLWPREVRYPASAAAPGEPSCTELVAALNHPHRTFCMLQKRSVLEAIKGEVRWPLWVLSTMPDHTLFVTAPQDGRQP